MMIVFHVPNNKSSSEEKDRHWSRLDKTKVGLKKTPGTLFYVSGARVCAAVALI